MNASDHACLVAGLTDGLRTRAGQAESVRGRALTEEHARDSFENLLFSICRFRELTGHYPVNITVGLLSISILDEALIEP